MAGMDMGFIAILTTYAVIMLGFGIFTISTLPSSCKEGELRSNTRGLIVASAITLTVFVSYAMCEIICAREKETEKLPWTLILFTLVMSGLITGYIGKIKKKLDDKGCSTKYTSALNKTASWMIFISIAAIVVTLGVLMYRSKQWNDVRRSAKRKATGQKGSGLDLSLD
jgi:Na+-driven multidrug efflux pump